MADIAEIKRSIVVLVDTREIRNQHILSKFSELGIRFKLKALKFGDYSFEINEKSFENVCVVERKISLTEIAGNFCKGRIRFETEFAKARAEGCNVTLLIEDDKARAKMVLRRKMDKLTGIDLDKKYSKTWRSDFTGNSMIASIKAFKDRYNLGLVFCKKTKTAEALIDTFNKAIEVYFEEVS